MVNLYLAGNKGFTSLRNIEEIYHKFINTVIIGRDKNIVNDYSDLIIKYCEKNFIDYVVQNKTCNNTSDYSIAIGWRFLINDDSKLIVFHDSILPEYRGFNPLVTSLINGDSEIGVTALKASIEYDKGEIIKQETIKISYPIKIESAIDKISSCYANLLNSIFDKILSGNLNSKPQNESLATYSLWRDKYDYKINWHYDSNTIKRFIDAVGYPYNGAFTFLDNSKIFIKDSEVISDVKISNRESGKVIFKEQNNYVIVCGKGLLKVAEFFDEKGEKIDLKKFRLRFR